MEEDIKILEGFIEENKKRPIILHQAIQNLIARNKELEEENQRRKAENKTLKSFVSAIFNETIEKEYLPKSKIKEKIEELERTKFGRCTDTIDILQELLEENKNE